ncbi:MAG: ABC transporter permease [Armatimonadetes bacterium]|nr:ABC transporter permease [Armatimonadota bacterium]
MGTTEDKRGYRQKLFSRELGAFTGLVLICTALTILEPARFPEIGNLLNILAQVSQYAIIAAGMTLVIISGGIDLSVGSVLSLSTCVGAFVATLLGFGGYTAIATTLVVGLCFGLVNGLLITKIGIPPFIATLGTMGVARGLAFRMTNGGTITNIPHEFAYLGSQSVGFIPAVVPALLFVYVIAHIVLARTRVGMYIYAVGGNENAARLSGVPIGKTKLFAYTCVGTLSALAGIVNAGRVGAVPPQAGEGYELDAIAAVVIGGTSLSGGQGRIIGSLIGALIMGVVRNGLNLMNVDPNWQRVVIGSIIILAATVDVLQKRRA